MIVSFSVTRSERTDIAAIVDRAIAIAKRSGVVLDCMSLTMDLTATHANGCPLSFARMLEADDFNLMHDVYGISRHINRDTGKLGDCFRPRMASRAIPAATA